MLVAGSSADSPQPAEEAAPSVELLMYLGEFEDAGGEFVDPLALEEGSPPLPAQAREQMRGVAKETQDDVEQSDD